MRFSSLSNLAIGFLAVTSVSAEDTRMDYD
jgi:hypothetical protein